MPKTRVRDLMTPDVITLREDDDILDAVKTMQYQRIRHLPVVQKDVLVGIISHRDLLRAQARAAARAPTEDTTVAPVQAKDVMTRDVQTVDPDVAADEAAMKLVDGKFGCLPVVDEGKLIGIVTEADVLKWAVGVLASANAGLDY